MVTEHVTSRSVIMRQEPGKGAGNSCCEFPGGRHGIMQEGFLEKVDLELGYD